MESGRIKTVRKYLKQNGRVDKHLAKISKLYKEKPKHPALSLFVMKRLGADEAFKYLILLHVLIHDQAIDLDLCSYLLQQINFQLDSSFNQFISQKYLNDYKLYLQKRCSITLSQSVQTQEERSLTVFRLINLIKMVSPFQQIIYTIGRYYPDQYKYIIDFNIILAKDIREVYHTITSNLTKPYCPSILAEISEIHEVMYPVVYNNYYYTFITNFCPKWIHIDYCSTTKKNKSKDMDSTFDSDIEKFLSNSISAAEKERQEEENDGCYIVREFPGQEQEEGQKPEDPIAA